jgi:hypothetical protein
MNVMGQAGKLAPVRPYEDAYRLGRYGDAKLGFDDASKNLLRFWCEVWLSHY